MKRVLSCLICLCLCLSALAGFVSCGGRMATAYVYVSYIGEDCLVGHIDGKDGEVKILCDPKDAGVALFDTVKVRYRVSDMVAESGTYTALTGNPAEYRWVLNRVESIRHSKPELGEPLIG